MDNQSDKSMGKEKEKIDEKSEVVEITEDKSEVVEIMEEKTDSQPPQEKKEEVNETISELVKERSDKNKKSLPIWQKIIMIIFFPITFIVYGFRAAVRKIKVPLTIKMTLIYTVLFLFLLTGFITIMYAVIKNQIMGGAEVLNSFKLALFVCVAVITVLFVSLGFVMSQFMLSPIRKITDKIDEINSENLSTRLDMVDSQDELRELTSRINDMLENLEQSFLRQQNFVGDASHELKTPIAVIQGYSNMLRRWGKSDEAILNEGIESIAKEADNMKKIVEQLLLLARLGKMTMSPTKFDLTEIVSQIASSYRIVIKSHEILFSGDEEIWVIVDKALLTESIRTLIDNAIKYTKAKGKIIVSVGRTDDGAFISVSDNGIGISEKDLPLVFDRFYRCDKARGRESGSSGLGLTIAKTVIEMLGGEIEVVSKVGEGSTFTIMLE